MTQFLLRLARIVCCVLLPIGATFLSDALALILTGTRPYSDFAVSLPIVAVVLFLLPINVISSTEPFRTGGSNRKLIYLLTFFGSLPVLLLFGFFVLLLRHD